MRWLAWICVNQSSIEVCKLRQIAPLQQVFCLIRRDDFDPASIMIGEEYLVISRLCKLEYLRTAMKSKEA